MTSLRDHQLFCLINLFLMLSIAVSISFNLEYFFSSGVLELLHWIPGLPQRHCHPQMIVKIGILWEEDGRKLLFHHIADVKVNIFFKSTFNLPTEDMLNSAWANIEEENSVGRSASPLWSREFHL